MNINDILSTIAQIAKDNGISKPFIVGGVPRDRYMGEKGKAINDIDITTGDDGSSRLSELVSKVINDSKHRTYDDGHSSLNIRGLKIDFSNNFNAPGIDSELNKMGVTNITSIKRELYSRDFTINALLEELDFSNIYDITGESEADIEAGIIKCPISSDISIGSDPRRILRALKFSIKYGFNIEDGLRNSMLKYRDNIRDLPKRFVQDRSNEIIKLDEVKGIDVLLEYKILPLVELNKPLYDVLIKHKRLRGAL